MRTTAASCISATLFGSKSGCRAAIKAAWAISCLKSSRSSEIGTNIRCHAHGKRNNTIGVRALTLLPLHDLCLFAARRIDVRAFTWILFHWSRVVEVSSRPVGRALWSCKDTSSKNAKEDSKYFLHLDGSVVDLAMLQSGRRRLKGRTRGNRQLSLMCSSGPCSSLGVRVLLQGS